MNLVDDPWIPILSVDGKNQSISLLEVFTSGDTYVDLAVRPHERVALYRLLLWCSPQAWG
ncbi:MAG: type I-E CRISPR-associated protein Cse1/CasA [Desulfovibrio sp.]|nr:type I-E CRISPR-associated protein Cse1/CasA [Desulfovibrio sp.]